MNQILLVTGDQVSGVQDDSLSVSIWGVSKVSSLQALAMPFLSQL